MSIHSRSRVLFVSILLVACGGSTAESGSASSGDEATGEQAVHEAAPASPETQHVTDITPSARWVEVLAAPDRLEADRALDAQRRPGEVFTFFGIEEGQRVADLFAGTGYTTELLARAVGPEGQVIAQNNAFVLERFARGPLTERLARPGLERVESVQLEMDTPIPDGVTDLDAVVFILAYHDTGWMETDRAAMNRAIFEALRPGGVYGIVDHAAEAGSGVRDVRTLHRIDEQTLIDEVLAAGFVLDAEADVLRNPDDPRDWNAAPSAAGERRGESDRFTLRFVRP